MEYIVPRFRAAYTNATIGGDTKPHGDTLSHSGQDLRARSFRRLNYYLDFTKSRGASNHETPVPSFLFYAYIYRPLDRPGFIVWKLFESKALTINERGGGGGFYLQDGKKQFIFTISRTIP